MNERVDRKKLRVLAQDSAGAHQWFAHLRGLQKRKRTTKKSTLQDFLRRSSLRDDAVKILRMLESTGCGTYRIRRKGHESYFEWQVDSQAVAKVALGDETQIGDVPADAEADVSSDSMAPDDHEAGDEQYVAEGWIKHQFLLRRNTPVVFCLPDDLSPSECERLSSWVKTLSFEGM